MRPRRLAAFAVIALVALLAIRHPSADIRIQAQDPGDPMPHRVQAALDTGLVGVSLLVTWTGHQLAH